jgi:hypothetical protein
MGASDFSQRRKHGKLRAMARKLSAKAQAKPDSATPPPPEPQRSSTALLMVVIAAVAIIGVFAYVRAGQQTETDQRAQAAPAPAVVDPPASAALGPHPQENLPPLPFDPAPARPAEVVRAAYKFAAEHPEVLSYVPCYCGCERSGHRGNEDCFVTARNANGDVTEWEPHGMT